MRRFIPKGKNKDICSHIHLEDINIFTGRVARQKSDTIYRYKDMPYVLIGLVAIFIEHFRH